MIDSFAMLCLSLFVIQMVYGIALCRDPFNSFIAGTFCSLGMFGMTMALRIQLSNHAEEFADRSQKQLMFEYMLGCLIMLFASLLLMG